MEQPVAEPKIKSIVIDEKQMGQFWALKVRLTNSQGAKAFGGRMLTAYQHPITKKMTHLFDVNGARLAGYMIDKLDVKFDIKNPEERVIIEWMLSHPEVQIEGLDLQAGIAAGKDTNAKLILTNLDRQELSGFEEQDIIDRVLGRLSDNTVNGLGIKKVRYLMSHFNLPYMDARYIKLPSTEKKVLLGNLKKFARGKDSSGNLNAQKIEDVLDEIDNLKYSYEVKEALRHQIIREYNGSYRYDNVPLAASLEGIVNYVKQNPEVYLEIQEKLYPILKSEGFN